MPATPALHVPLITPLDTKGGIDTGALANLARDILQEGADGLVLFGTLGEAQSFSIGERIATLESMLAAGIEPSTLMVGTGAAALSDVVALSRHALAVGCARQLLLPPFFFKGVSDEGIYRFIAEVIDGVGEQALRLTLYDIPTVVSVSIAAPVIARLVETHGAVIAGIKDSVPDWDHVRASLQGFPNLSVFVGNEIFVPAALGLGAAGAISGLGNIAPRQMAAIASGSADGESAVFGRMSDLYAQIGRHPVIPVVKALTGRQRGDDRLGVPRPPLVRFDLEQDPRLAKALDAVLAESV